jgi:hypothetical protein
MTFAAVITAFCLCSACCGEDSSRTASGRAPVLGVTIAAPRSVPFGTWVEIQLPAGRVLRRRVDDRTHRRYDGRWDVLVRTHLEAREFGLRKGTVKIVKGGRR